MKIFQFHPLSYGPKGVDLQVTEGRSSHNPKHRAEKSLGGKVQPEANKDQNKRDGTLPEWRGVLGECEAHPLVVKVVLLHQGVHEVER